MIAISATNLYGLLAGKAPTMRDIAQHLQGENGRSRLRSAMTLAWLAQAYLIALIFPLKALNWELGLAWSVMMILAVLETIHTQRRLSAAANGEEPIFPLHDARWYPAYQALFNAAVLAGCVLLLLPR